jgi:hypothetical protein
MSEFKNECLQFIREYDQYILSGLKTYLTIAALFVAYFFMPEGKLQGFTAALGLAHLFALRVARS